MHLGGEYRGEKIVPQTLSNVLWHYYLHPEDKSLGPDGTPCDGWARGLLQRRPVEAILPFNFLDKEVERRGQEGEDSSLIEGTGFVLRGARRMAKTRPADPTLLQAIKRFSLSRLEASGLSRDTIIQARRGACLHPNTRARLAWVVKKLETAQLPFRIRLMAWNAHTSCKGGKPRIRTDIVPSRVDP